MTETLFQPSGVSSTALISTSIVLIIVYVVTNFIASKSKNPISKVLGSQTDVSFYQTILDAYRKDRNESYIIPENPDRMILPPRYIDEIKSLPESKISFEKSIVQHFHGEYTRVGPTSKALIESVKVDLTRSIAKTLEGLQDEATFAFAETFGDCGEWTSFHLYSKILRIIAFLSGRIFVGLPLCRDEQWLNVTINYTVDTFAAVEPVRSQAKIFLPFIAPFMQSLQKIAQHLEVTRNLLRPVIKERLDAMQSPGFDPPQDTIQFMLKNSGEKANDLTYQADSQLSLSMAAIHTTSMNLTHVLYDLCAHPEYVEPLREELAGVLAADGNTLVKTSMTKLRKMDSFMKESQRLNPPNTVSMMRLATDDVKLSGGLTIPKGTSFAFSANGPNMDPVLFKDPEEFKGFRFAELRDIPGNENRFQFVTTGHDSLNFGHGNHACPGRFFASNEIKVAFAHILQNYDLKFKEGGRPANYYHKTNITPNPMAEVMFRKRRL